MEISNSNKPPAAGETPSVAAAYTKGSEFLLSIQNNAGWWPYKPGNGPSMEATSWCALAVRKSVDANRVMDFFVKNQNKDGGWSTAPETGFSDWATGPVLLAFRTLYSAGNEKSSDTRFGDSVNRGLLHLSDSRVDFYPPVGRLLLLIAGLVVGKGDAELKYSRGWPWDPGCFHWVEPTSYHLLALKVPGLPEAGAYKEVIKFANKFLKEHACKGGGWNHGNELSLGAYLPPYRVTTAEALLAQQDQVSAEAVADGLKVLSAKSNDDDSALSLAWSILALNAYGKNVDKETAFLIKRQKPDGSFGVNLMASALSVLALEAVQGTNVLKFGST